MSAAAHRSAACCDLASEIARSFGELRLRLYGTSMLPAMWPGDEVTVRRCAFSDLRPGQVVLFRGEGTLVAHRLLRIAGGYLILRGDSLPLCDPPVREDWVVGRVTAIFRDGRQITLKRSLGRWLVASLVRHSEFCKRITLRLGSYLWSL